MKKGLRELLALVGFVRVYPFLSVAAPTACRAATSQPTRVQIAADSRARESTVAALKNDLKAVDGIILVSASAPAVSIAPDISMELRSSYEVEEKCDDGSGSNFCLVYLAPGGKSGEFIEADVEAAVRYAFRIRADYIDAGTSDLPVSVG
jgi:hypothetical protein